MKKTIYFDHAATTPVDKKVLEEMLPYFSEKFGNPMSVHSFGQEALEVIDSAREKVADFFGASTSEIIFTSGATESNNLAIKGIVKSYYSDPKKKGKLPHLITTTFEHHCILDTFKSLEKEGLAEITLLSVGKKGIVNLDDIKKEIKGNTILISIMYVNNEIGTVQPIKKIGELIKKINEKRQEEKKRKIIFHSDATQAVNHFNCNVKEIVVDMLSMSAHKIYGPKGTGMLYIKKDTPIKNIQNGGDQEYKMRGGTHNVPGIVGLGKAVSMIKEREKENENISKLSDYLVRRILKEIPDSYLNGDSKNKSPAINNFRFNNVEGEGLLLSLDIEGIAASTGSACSSGALDPSHVLLSLGLKHEQAHGSLRISLGKDNTKEEIDIFIEKLKETISRLRKISGNVLADFK